MKFPQFSAICKSLIQFSAICKSLIHAKFNGFTVSKVGMGKLTGFVYQ